MQEALRQLATSPSTPPETLQALAAQHPELLLLVLENPAAPSDWLASLYRHKDREVRLRITKNPNTPMQILLTIGGEFPQELLLNPTFSLALLESPEFYQQVHNGLLAALAPFPELPLPLMHRAIIEYDHMRRQLSKNPALPEEIAFILAGDEQFDIRRQVLQGSTLPLEKKRLLRRLGIYVEHHAPQASDRSLTTEELSLCCESGGFAQWLVARHPNVTPEMLSRLSNAKSALAVAGVARSPKTPQNILRRLEEKNASTTREQISIALLENPALPLDIVKKFAARTNTPHAMKIVLAARPELSESQLEGFSKSGRIAIRVAIAKNPSTPTRILTALVKDDSHSVRIALTMHPNLSDESAVLLASDRNSGVRNQLAKRPDLSREALQILSQTRSVRELESLARRSDAPTELLSRLLSSPSEKIFRAALHNDRTPTSLGELMVRVREKQPLNAEEVALLARHSEHTRALLAQHPQASPELLIELIACDEPQLLLAAAKSPRVTPRMLEGLIKRDLTPEISMVAAKRLLAMESDITYQEELFAKLPEWLRERLKKKLAKKREREIASAPETSIAELEALAKTDERELLRLIASRRDLPVQALSWLKGRFARKLLENKEFVARLQENPEAFYQLPPRVLCGVLSQPALPDMFLRWAISHPSGELRHVVAKNPSLTPEMIVALSQTKDIGYTLRRSLAQHPNVPKELLASFLQSPDPWLKIWAERRLTA